ncbi:MAG TPA: hypothetical protein VEK06_02280, partial [Myxococcota bacterium]|nr:hypothetical protein [Myxococcota bacterium]
MRKLILTLCAILMMNGCIIWHELGGASRYQPKDLEHRLSTDAQALLHAALSELKGQQIFDYHAHVIGLGQDDTGIYLNKRVQSWLHPEEHVRFLIFSSASGLKNFNHAD